MALPRRRGLRHRTWCWVLASTLAALTTSARARAEALHVRVSGGACPSASQLRQQLSPLLDHDTDLTVSSESAPADVPAAEVDDLGEAYRVALGTARRSVDDVARDCVERARVAAVFLAMNRVTERRGVRTEPRLGVTLIGAGIVAPTRGVGTAGAGLGLWLVRDPLRFGVDAFASYPARLSLTIPASGAGGEEASARAAVRLVRAPLRLSVVPLWRRGRFALGPLVGLGVELLALRADDIPSAARALRVTPTASAALYGRWATRRHLAIALTLGVDVHARVYDLTVEPLGPLARTPRTWLDLALSLEWTLVSAS